MEEAKEEGAAKLNYGAVITVVINFVMMALIIFVMVKGMNALANRDKEGVVDAPTAPTTKGCPYCMSEISSEATRCTHCTSIIVSDIEDEIGSVI